MSEQLIEINFCPLCNSPNRKVLFRPFKDKIQSKICKCAGCSFVYNGIKLKDKNNEILDNKFVANYDSAEVFSSWENLYVHKLGQIENFINKHPRNKTLKLLDLGCGPGTLISAAKKRGWTEFGVEPFINSFQLAKSKGFNVYNQFLADIRFPDNYFDLITAIEVVEHFENPIKEFKEIKRVLKSNGVFVLQTANVDGLVFKLKQGKAHYFYYDHLCYFSIKTLTSLLDKLDLKIIKAVPDEVKFSARLNWCKSNKEKIKWGIFYFIRLFMFNKPALGTMTVYIAHKNFKRQG